MSYNTMDHAKWVESNNAASNNMGSRRRKNAPILPEKLTEFQVKVCDILGMVFGGAYNAPIDWDKVDWRYGGGGVSVVLKHPGRGFSTFDFDQLTKFTFLCHAARIRGDIEPGGYRSFRLSFWPRQARGGMAERHPDLTEAIVAFNEYLPADHRIIYREPATTDTVAA